VFYCGADRCYFVTMNEERILKALDAFCAEKALRLTPPRKHVYLLIKQSKAPMTAYEVLEALKLKMENPKPPTAYRALDFLTQNGLVHRIESLNAYIACAENHNHRGSQFLICDSCGRVEEAHLCHLPEKLKNQTQEKGFALSYWNAELHGLCAKCS
jgi:Fur family zinc uptake transcriptional regulator